MAGTNSTRTPSGASGKAKVAPISNPYSKKKASSTVDHWNFRTIIRHESGANRTPLVQNAPGIKQTQSRGPTFNMAVATKPKVDYDELAKGILATEIFDDSAKKATEGVLWNTHLMEGPIANLLVGEDGKIGKDKTVGRLLLKTFLKSKSFQRAVEKIMKKLVEKEIRNALVASGVIKVLEVDDDSGESDSETEFV